MQETDTWQGEKNNKKDNFLKENKIAPNTITTSKIIKGKKGSDTTKNRKHPTLQSTINYSSKNQIFPSEGN